MRKIFFILLASTVAACSTQQQQEIVTVACTADALAPSVIAAAGNIATIVDPASVAAIKQVDAVTAATHPLVQNACNGQTPIAGTVNVVAVPVAAPVSQTTVAILPTTK